jgi:spermidine dehydrogenase
MTAKTKLMQWHEVPDDGLRPKSEGEDISRQLDTISLEDHLMARHHISRETVRNFLSPVEGGGYGLGPDTLSAYCAYAIETEFPGDGDDKLGDMFAPGCFDPRRGSSQLDPASDRAVKQLVGA